MSPGKSQRQGKQEHRVQLNLLSRLPWDPLLNGPEKAGAAVVMDTEAPSAGLPLSSPRTGKGIGPGHCAAAPRFLVLGWRKQGAPNYVFLYPPRETPCLLAPALLLSCSHTSQQARPGTPSNTITLQIKLDSHFTVTTEPGMGASQPHPPATSSPMLGEGSV